MIQLDMFSIEERDLILWELERIKKKKYAHRKAFFNILKMLQDDEKEMVSKVERLEKIGVQR